MGRYYLQEKLNNTHLTYSIPFFLSFSFNHLLAQEDAVKRTIKNTLLTYYK